MNPRPGIASDRDAIVEQLAQLDLSDPADGSKSPEPPSTVRELKAELDTLLGQLREPAGLDPFAEESGLRRAQELVRAIGVEYGPPAKDERPELGRIGPYELLAKLGEGGMGAVYKALHSSLEKVVALKVLPRERLHPDAIARFKREMKAVGKLDHPNIVRATDAGEADGDHFLVMEYVDGLDLSQLLRRVGPLAAADACELVRQAAVGLQHAHQRGMVHRDIKPNNIMLTWGDEHAPAVKILDMGLALLSEPVASPHGDLTSTGQMMGTIEYMSPEQGLDTHNVDIRSDIYSLGATLYKLLCGKAPFSGERYNTPGKMMVALATEKPASIGTLRSDLPAGLVTVIDRMLAKSPAERFATPAEVAQELTPYAAGADLSRLSASSRQQAAAGDIAPGKMASTEEFLSSPHTGTQSRTPLRDVQEKPSPAAPQPLLARLAKTAYFRPALIATAASLLFIAAATVIRILTADGILILTVDDPKVIVEIDGQKARVKQTSDGNTKTLEISVDPGDHALVVKTADGILLKTDGRFTMEAGGKKQLTAVLERAKPSPTVSTLSSDPDRRAAEWVLSVGGSISIREKNQERHRGASADLPKVPFELTDVNLTSSPKVNDAGLAHFQDCKNLLQLDLGGTQLTDAGLAHFKDCQNLTYLRLAGTKVSDAGLAHFKDCKNLANLSLEWSGVGDAGLAYFKECKNLSSLNLSGIRVSDAGLANFAGCPKLGSVYVKNTKVTEAGVKKLAAALPGCKIEWDGGTIEPTVAADPDRRAAEWVLSIGGDISIKENGKERQVRGVGNLPQGAFELTVVGLGETPKVNDAGLAVFKDCKNLTWLDLRNTQVSDAGLAHFKECRNLTQLSLEGTQVSDAGLAIFKDCKNLTYLNLGYTKVSDAGLVHFKDCQNLTRLFLGGVTQVTDAGLVHFKGCKNLIGLDVGGMQLTDAGLAHFKDCKNLSKLHLYSTRVTDAGLANFKDFKDLAFLNLHACIAVSDAGLVHLADCPKLGSLNVKLTKVTEAGVKKLSAALPQCKIEWDGGVIEPNPSIEADRRAAEYVLSIGGTVSVNGEERVRTTAAELPKESFQLTNIYLLDNQQVSDAGLVHFNDCKNLTSVGLNGTKVTDAGLAHFKNCKNLTHLDLTNTKTGDAGLANFRDCKDLTFLELWGTKVSDTGLANFKNCKNLTYLQLSTTQVGDAGLSHFDDCKNLTYLNLGGTQVSDAGLVHFKNCKNLTHLNLSVTQVSDAGLVHFKNCKNLTYLHLGSTKVSDAGLAQFKDSTTLTWLYLGDTKMTDAGLAHFKNSKNLTYLNLNNIMVSDAGLAHLKECKNLTILILRRTKVTTAGIDEMRKALPQCKIEWDGGVIEPKEPAKK